MVSIRDARPDDHPAYARLMPELGVPDPAPSREAWWSSQGARTRIAELETGVVGYLMYELIGSTFFVRNVVSDPRHRGIGVGRALMKDAGEIAHRLGAVEWRLNVKEDNAPAIGLYESIGFRVFMIGHVVVFPWSGRDRLPMPSEDLNVRPATPADDEVLERAFGIQPGLLAVRRGAGRILLAAFAAGRPAGVAVFDPTFPGAYPMCAADPAAARGLFDGLASHRIPIEDPDSSWRETSVQLALEDSGDAAEALIDAGGDLLFRVLKMRAAL